MSKRRQVIGLVIVAALAMGVALVAALMIRFGAPEAWETLTGHTPKARVLAYLEAIWHGDREGALSQWELPGWQQALPERHAELSLRRDTVTDTLLAARLDGNMTILSMEWWTTCCEPHVTCDSSSAGGARVRVQILDNTGAPLGYWFDIFARDQPYWGDSWGNPLRRWVIRDVYPMGEQPLFFRLVYESNVRWLDARPATTPD